MIVKLVLAAAAATLFAVPAAADPAPDGDASSGRVICKKEPPKVGSRLGATRFCGTAEQWRARDQSKTEMRKYIERHQTQRPLVDPKFGG